MTRAVCMRGLLLRGELQPACQRVDARFWAAWERFGRFGLRQASGRRDTGVRLDRTFARSLDTLRAVMKGAGSAPRRTCVVGKRPSSPGEDWSPRESKGRLPVCAEGRGSAW